LSKERISFDDLLMRLVSEFRLQGLAQVDRSSISIRLNEIEPRLATKKRDGARAAREEFDIVKGSLTAERPLQIVQIDHTKMDVFAVDIKSGRILGRPTLSVCLDIATRMIIGLRISMDPPSAVALSKVFYDAVMPKAQQLERLQLNTQWFTYGQPEAVHTDNGTDFVSNAFTAGLKLYGVSHIRRPIGRPEYGGHVERVLGSLNSYIHTLPGSTKSNIRERGSRDPRKTACLSLHDIERGVVSYVCNVYHKRRHSSLHETPENAWNRWWRQAGELPMLPSDSEQFRLNFLPHDNRRITKHGVTFEHLHYRSPQLQRIRNCGVTQVKFHYDPDDLRQIYVHDDKNSTFAVPCEKRFHGRTSFAEWKLLRDPIESNMSRLSDADLVRHYQTHDRIIKVAKARKKPELRHGTDQKKKGHVRAKGVHTLTPFGFGGPRPVGRSDD
jgi:putative transposase